MNLADFCAAFAGLEAREAGFMLRLVAHALENGGALPVDPASLYRIGGASSQPERDTVERLAGLWWHQVKHPQTGEPILVNAAALAHLEIEQKRAAHVHAIALQRAKAGALGAKARWAKYSNCHNKEIANAIQTNGNCHPPTALSSTPKTMANAKENIANAMAPMANAINGKCHPEMAIAKKKMAIATPTHRKKMANAINESLARAPQKTGLESGFDPFLYKSFSSSSSLCFKPETEQSPLVTEGKLTLQAEAMQLQQQSDDDDDDDDDGENLRNKIKFKTEATNEIEQMHSLLSKGFDSATQTEHHTTDEKSNANAYQDAEMGGEGPKRQKVDTCAELDSQADERLSKPQQLSGESHETSKKVAWNGRSIVAPDEVALSWQDAFPDLGVGRELDHASVWLRAHPEAIPDSGDLHPFVASWLLRESRAKPRR